MNDASPDDFVRLPVGHVLRECDFISVARGALGLNRCRDTIGNTVRNEDEFYCRRKDYPKPKRVVVYREMQRPVAAGYELETRWFHEAHKPCDGAWVDTGNTREVEVSE